MQVVILCQCSILEFMEIFLFKNPNIGMPTNSTRNLFSSMRYHAIHLVLLVKRMSNP